MARKKDNAGGEPAPVQPLPGEPQPFKYTSFAVMGYLNGKNVSANYQRSDAQSWTKFHPSDDDVQKEREAKRRRLAGVDAESPSQADLNVLKQATAPVSRAESKDAEAEEDQSPAMQFGSRTIVLHPGSRWLRLGRATDFAPKTVPMAIARRMRKTAAASKGKERAGGSAFASNPTAEAAGTGSAQTNGNNVNEGASIGASTAHTARPRREKASVADGEEEDDDDDDMMEVDETDDPIALKINSLRGDFKSRMRVYKLRGTTNGTGQAIAYNEAVQADFIPEYDDLDGVDWTDPRKSPKDYYVGYPAVNMFDPEANGYALRFPFFRNNFNTEGYSSSRELLGDIERIIVDSIDSELGISRDNLKHYSVVLLIPDLYDDLYLREMADMLMRSIGFKQMCLQQEGIAAVLGAGVSSACVVDVGAATTTVSCVDDGYVVPETRVMLNFGGDDITEALFTMLMRNAFPWRDADLSRWQDFMTLDLLKQKMVVLSEGDVSLNVNDFFARRPGEKTRKYAVRTYDEIILAPYLLFAPRMVSWDKKRVEQPKLWSREVDDFAEFGGNAITTAMRGLVRHLIEPAATVAASAPPPPAAVAAARDASTFDSPAGSPMPEAKAPGPSTDEVVAVPAVAAPVDSIKTEETPLPASETPAPPRATSSSHIDIAWESSKIPLDVAVVESIMAIGSDDKSKRIGQSILVVGGCGNIHNIGFALQSRVSPQLGVRLPAVEQAAIVPPPKDLDPRIIAWKGVSIMCKVEAANELWIRREDWELAGAKTLRDRCVFLM